MAGERKKEYTTTVKLRHSNLNFDKACKEVDKLKEKIEKSGFRIIESHVKGFDNE